MKTKFLTSALLLTSLSALAVMPEGGSSGVGGGGDAEETRVNEIRSDILKWITDGGAKGLKLSTPVAHYEEEMKKVLRNKEVVIGFTDSKVEVGEVEKTCRSFVYKNKFHMLCNLKRFQKTQASDQYRLIHHEYAGLAGLEKNEGAASDYEISGQLTDFLKEEKVLRLSILPQRKNDYETWIQTGFECWDPTPKQLAKIHFSEEKIQMFQNVYEAMKDLDKEERAEREEIFKKMNENIELLERVRLKIPSHRRSIIEESIPATDDGSSCLSVSQLLKEKEVNGVLLLKLSSTTSLNPNCRPQIFGDSVIEYNLMFKNQKAYYIGDGPTFMCAGIPVGVLEKVNN